MEDIDIGGVTLLRAAAKNHARVCVLSDPNDYAEFLQQLDKGEVTEKSRQLYALKSFEHTADYETTIADFFRKKYASDGIQQLSLRYGANPHQKPAATFSKDGPLPFKVLNGAPGYINLLGNIVIFKHALGASTLKTCLQFETPSRTGSADPISLFRLSQRVAISERIKIGIGLPCCSKL